jgi:RNA polymerase sigma-70 factor (ECF subfamily)
MRELKNCIEKARAGENSAQHALYKKCFAFLMPVCMRYRTNEQDALAALNKAFLKILRSLQPFDDEMSFVRWCKRITVNTLIDEYRKDKRRREVMQKHAQENGKDYHIDYNEAEKALEAEDIRMIIQELPEPTRTVFNLHAIEGYSHAEIAELLDMPEGTSKWHVFRARKELQIRISKFHSHKLILENGK